VARRIIVSEAKMAIPIATSSPDPEVPAKAQRRRFRAEDKKRILDEVERATGHGAIGRTAAGRDLFFHLARLAQGT